MSDRAWLICKTHDVRFLLRSPASLEHVDGNRAGCKVEREPNPPTVTMVWPLAFPEGARITE